eukprot:PhM_4_TR4815/c0_g2_i1/m.37901
MRPGLALQPHQFSAPLPPLSSAQSPNAVMRSHSPSANSSSNMRSRTPPKPVHITSGPAAVVGTMRPGNKIRSTSKPAAAAAAAPAPSGGGSLNPIYEAYVHNLKEQIECLELELKYVKENSAKEVEARKAAEALVPTKMSGGGGMTDSFNHMYASLEEIERCKRIDHEVRELKAHYARREVDQAAEVAKLQEALEAAKAAAKHAEEDAIHKMQIEMDARINAIESYNGQQRATIVEENIRLQKTVERITLEGKTRDVELLSALKSKEAQLKEFMDAREKLRAANNRADMLQRQYDEGQTQLRHQQDLYRLLEGKERDLRTQLSMAQTDHEERWSARVSRLEEQVKSLTHDLSEKTLLAERSDLLAKQAEQRLSVAVNATTDYAQQVEHLKLTLGEHEAKIDKYSRALQDVTSEREFHKLAAERAQADISMLQVKITYLQKQLNEEGTVLSGTERQHRATIAELEAMRRELQQREGTYKQMESRDEDLRRHVRVIDLENHSLREEIAQYRQQGEGLRVMLATQQKLVDQLKNEHNMTEALHKLDQTKHELQNLLQTQLRLNTDVSSTVVQLQVPPPSLMAPPSSSTSANNNNHHAIALGDVTLQSIDQSRLDTGDVSSPPESARTQHQPPDAYDVQKEIAELQEKIRKMESTSLEVAPPSDSQAPTTSTTTTTADVTAPTNTEN